MMKPCLVYEKWGLALLGVLIVALTLTATSASQAQSANPFAGLPSLITSDIDIGPAPLAVTGACDPFVSPGNGTTYTMHQLKATLDLIPSVCPIQVVTGPDYVNFIILSHITISRDDRLIITAGERLVFHDSVQLLIRGKLDAVGIVAGVPGLDVQFTSIDDYTSGISDPGAWYGVRFVDPVIVSNLKNVTIRNAEYGVQCVGVNQGALLLEGLQIESCYTGIYLQNSSPVISGSTIRDCWKRPATGQDQASGTGIFCTSLSNPVITRCTVTGNEVNGIGITLSSRPNLGQVGSFFSPGENNLFGNFENEVFNVTPNNIFAQNNFWGGLIHPNDIEDVIYDDNDNPASGVVDFSSPSATPFQLPSSVEPGGWRGYR